MTKTLTALDAFTELRTMTAKIPENYAAAWTRARNLMAIVEKARDSGQLADELNAKKDEKRYVELEEQIRADLAEAGASELVGVIFTATPNDNGYFLNGSTAWGYDANGERYFVQFSPEVDEAFNDLYGSVGPHAGFGFNVRTGASDFDGEDVDNIPGYIGIKVRKDQ